MRRQCQTSGVVALSRPHTESFIQSGNAMSNHEQGSGKQHSCNVKLSDSFFDCDDTVVIDI